ncbi:phage head-tail connector protein [Symbiobacterium terraclitae]|uniref:phage head-tail connector protein n=1 Tax=Symbiobacterium terraclitae TaxID=557451 RepID=UPI0035B53571
MTVRDEVVKLVKARLRLTDDSLDTLIESYVDEIEQRILHYCNLTQVPAGLRWTWASMVIDALRIEQSSVEEIDETADRGASVRVGDTSVSPSSAGGVTNTGKSVIDQVVLNYRVDLNRYRKLRW